MAYRSLHQILAAPALARLSRSANARPLRSGTFHQRPAASFSHVAAARQSEQKPDSSTGQPGGTSADPAKAALKTAVDQAAARESGGGGGGGKAGQAAQDGGRTSQSDGASPPMVEHDALAEGGARGRTGGGQKLESSSDNAPPQPKILSGGLSGQESPMKLTEEQKKEVERHNKEFEKGYDRAQQAATNRVDKKFWADDKAGSG